MCLLCLVVAAGQLALCFNVTCFRSSDHHDNRMRNDNKVEDDPQAKCYHAHSVSPGDSNAGRDVFMLYGATKWLPEKWGAFGNTVEHTCGELTAGLTGAFHHAQDPNDTSPPEHPSLWVAGFWVHEGHKKCVWKVVKYVPLHHDRCTT